MKKKENSFLSQLYSDNFEKLYLYAYSCIKKCDIAEDLVNEAFVCASKKVTMLLTHENPFGWLMQTLKYEIRSYIKKADQIPPTVSYTAVDEDYIPPIATPDLSADQLLWENGLSDEEQAECRLYFLDNASHKDAAETLGISVSASQKRRERLRKKLQEALKIFSSE